MTLPNKPKLYSSKRTWLAPLLYLLAGGALLGLSTNLAKLAGEMQLSALAFCFGQFQGRHYFCLRSPLTAAICHR